MNFKLIIFTLCSVLGSASYAMDAEVAALLKKLPAIGQKENRAENTMVTKKEEAELTKYIALLSIDGAKKPPTKRIRRSERKQLDRIIKQLKHDQEKEQKKAIKPSAPKQIIIPENDAIVSLKIPTASSSPEIQNFLDTFSK